MKECFTGTPSLPPSTADVRTDLNRSISWIFVGFYSDNCLTNILAYFKLFDQPLFSRSSQNIIMLFSIIEELIACLIGFLTLQTHSEIAHLFNYILYRTIKLNKFHVFTAS